MKATCVQYTNARSTCKIADNDLFIGRGRGVVAWHCKWYDADDPGRLIFVRIGKNYYFEGWSIARMSKTELNEIWENPFKQGVKVTGGYKNPLSREVFGSIIGTDNPQTYFFGGAVGMAMKTVSHETFIKLLRAYENVNK